MGCASSTAAATKAQASTVQHPVLLKSKSQLVGSSIVDTPKGRNKPEHFKLFEEHQKLLAEAGAEYHDSRTSFTSKDVLVVVDMQNDFVPVEDAPDGGRLSVAEGATAAESIVGLIDKAARAGARIIATRDYHPKNHCSFQHMNGPFPAHCVQGNKGSFFYPPIEQALDRARHEQDADVRVVFKGFAADVDSFGSVRYDEARFDERSLGFANGTKANTEICGCCAIDWTGAFHLECSNVDEDLNAPPDVMAVFAYKSLTEELQEFRAKRLFVVGLAMDICVLDTALNAASLNIASDGIFMPVDASRAVHIPSVGTFGSGFLADPNDIVTKTRCAGVKLCHSACIQHTERYQL